MIISHPAKRLFDYFEECLHTDPDEISVGVEIETHFRDGMGHPISVSQSQYMLDSMVHNFDWTVAQWKRSPRKGYLTTEIRDKEGNKILYELGRQNIEVAFAPKPVKLAVSTARKVLDTLYFVGERMDAYPYLGPILETADDLLVIPDQRDAIWLELDGRPALELLARSAAVQFTIAVSPKEVMRCLKKLGRSIGIFLEDYPQEVLWRRYIQESEAGYHPWRYGGPLFFDKLKDYCERLIEHDVVSGSKLVPHTKCKEVNIPLFLRSVWWYFRLKRYGGALCIEVRPMARRSDDKLQEQLEMVLDIMF